MKDSHLKHSIFGLDFFISCQRIITLSLGSVHKSKTCVSLQGRCGLPAPPHLVEFTPYVLQYRYEGDLLDSNGGQTRDAVLSFMEEYGIQKKTLDFVLKISVFGASTPPLRTFNGYELCTATKLCVLFRYHNMKVSRPKTKCFRWVFRFFGNLFENLYAMA